MNAYSINDLKAAGQGRATNEAISAGRTMASRQRMLFLCHSHKDREAALGLKRIIESQGASLYIDWEDAEMPESPNQETAKRIRDKISQAELFLFLATANSLASRWCPWEIGYADGKKPIDSIVIVPTKDDAGRFYGNEYLQLYRRLEPSSLRPSAYQPAPPTIIRPGQYAGVPVTSL